MHAVSAEGALHLDDVLTRRTRISIETAHRGVETAPRVAALMARELGWDEERTAREVAHYAARVDAERESQRMPDDHTADAARLGRPGRARPRCDVTRPGATRCAARSPATTGGRRAGPAG